MSSRFSVLTGSWRQTIPRTTLFKQLLRQVADNLYHRLTKVAQKNLTKSLQKMVRWLPGVANAPFTVNLGADSLGLALLFFADGRNRYFGLIDRSGEGFI
jgi:hypothetical protein